MRTPIALATLAVAATAGWFAAGTLTDRDVMTPKCRERTMQLGLAKGALVKSQADRDFIAMAQDQIGRECGPRGLWGRL